MRIESIESLIDWTREVHIHLAKAFAEALQTAPEERAKELLVYLQQHEAELADMVAGHEKQADKKALQTRVYDHGVHTPVEVARLSEKPYGTMSYDAIAEDVCTIHNQIIDLYDYLIGRSAIPEEQELLESLFNMEQHETMQMTQQINRGRDM